MRWPKISGVLVSASLAMSCELLTTFDRTKIMDAGAGGAMGDGGTGGDMTTGGGSTGGAMCVDPAADCVDALSDECKMWICDTDSACTEANVPDGMDATTQTAGDCKKNVCMTGAVTPEDDDTDTLDDMNDCTVDSCLAGAPQSEPAAAGAMCAMDGGKVCDGMGACVECNSAAECQSNFCVDSVCCDTACGDACKACNVAGMVGTCSNDAQGMQDTCTAGQTCDMGACVP